MNVSRVARTVLIALLTLFAGAALASPAPTFSERLVAGGDVIFPSSETNPEMDGRYIVYEVEPSPLLPGILDTDIKYYDVGTGLTANVTDRAGDDDADQIYPDISMDTVVYQSSQTLVPQIFLYNIPWSNTQQLTNSVHPQTRPRISGRYVMWHDAATDALMYHRTFWPVGMNHQMPATVGVHPGSWDIDGDTVVYARELVAGSFEFFRWTIGSMSMPQSFFVDVDAGTIADIRLHNGRITYTRGGTTVQDIAIYDGWGGQLATGSRDADLFHDVRAYELVASGDLHFMNIGEWVMTLVTGASTETNPSAFGNRVAYQRNTYNGDIIMTIASEPLIDRTSGSDRYATAVEVSKEYFRRGANSVVLCTGENFPDALSAAPWARFMNAPLLLTKKTYVPQVVLDEIERLGATSVWIIGGDAAVAPSVQTQLEAEGVTVDRQLQGTDRYATSKQIAYFLYDALMADGRPFSGMAFVARGDAFPDALSIAPIAATTYSPILLVKTNAPLPPATANVLEFLPIREAFIVGGTDVVSQEVEEAIEVWTTLHNGSSSPATRFGGVDRYATSASVLGNAVSMNWLDLDTVGIATGKNFPDALGGGAALGTYGSPVLLTKPNALPSSTRAVLIERADEIGRVDIFGGADVVSEAIRTDIAGILQ